MKLSSTFQVNTIYQIGIEQNGEVYRECDLKMPQHNCNFPYSQNIAYAVIYAKLIGKRMCAVTALNVHYYIGSTLYFSMHVL